MTQGLIAHFIFGQTPLASCWHHNANGLKLTGLGQQDLLMDSPLTAFFSSSQCTGMAIYAAIDWALGQARERAVVIGGFHSSLEQSVLKVLLEARSPAIIMLARPVEVRVCHLDGPGLWRKVTWQSSAPPQGPHG